MKSQNKSSLLKTLLIPLLSAAFLMQACAGGETAGSAGGTGGDTGSGGKATTGSGGSQSSGSGGATTTSSGGKTGSGGATGSGSGGSTTTGSGGSTTTGSGGSTTTGSGGSTTTTGSGGATSTTGGLASMDGYATSGTWKGYAYSSTFGTTATIMPTKFTGTQLCVMGTVAADTTYASGAMLGWNINQDKATTATEPPIMTATPSGTGISVTLSGNTSGLRIQLQDAGTGRWCAPVTGLTNMIPWASFNTMCWDPTKGTAFSPATALKDVSVVVPSGTAAVPFNFCLVDAKTY